MPERIYRNAVQCQDLLNVVVLGVLKRPSRKSLPSSLFQREDSFWGFDGKFPFFLLWEKG
jgi:hypothetical protein